MIYMAVGRHCLAKAAKLVAVMTDSTLIGQLSIETLIDQWPQAIAVFHKYKTACAGCAIAPFCTIEDAAREYNIPLDDLIDAIHTAVSAKTDPEQ